MMELRVNPLHDLTSALRVALAGGGEKIEA